MGKGNNQGAKMKLNDLIIPAFRYYLGRKTIAVHGFIDWLVAHKHILQDFEKELICREIVQYEQLWGDLGHELDRRKWMWLKSEMEEQK